MITLAAVASRYASQEPYLGVLRQIVRNTLQTFVDDKGYALLSRIKPLESIAEKLESGKYKSWDDIEDLVAFMIVVPTLSDEAEVLEFLSVIFQEVTLRSRGGAQKAPDVF
jgi:ppGpp synthetase/RelA/SpoT-type nucleotidyltranferase